MCKVYTFYRKPAIPLEDHTLESSLSQTKEVNLSGIAAVALRPMQKSRNQDLPPTSESCAVSPSLLHQPVLVLNSQSGLKTQK